MSRAPYGRDELVPEAAFRVATGLSIPPLSVRATVRRVDSLRDAVHYHLEATPAVETRHTTIAHFLELINAERA